VTVRRLPIPEGIGGLRADQGLSKLLGLSRSAVADIIAEDGVRQNDVIISKSTRLTPGTWVDVRLPGPKKPLLPQAEEVVGMKILHVDSDVVVVDKPVGVAAHPTIGWEGKTVLGGLAAAGIDVTTSGPPERKGIVHRLDVGTSGVMVVARSERAYTLLKRAFRERTVDKTYHAVVQGHPDPLEGTIEAAIGRHPKKSYKFAVVEGGKMAVTHYETLEAFREASLLKVHLETGRTHQIRVHFSSLHHPCVGDPMYGCDPKLAKRLGLIRQWLHAVSLGFDHPNGTHMVIESGYPEDLSHALEILRAN